MMFEAQLLYGSGSVTPTNTVVYSPWFSRRADNALFTLDVVAISASASITVRAFHKNTEDTGDGTLVGTIATRTTSGRTTTSIAGLKEQVRYEYSVGSGTSKWVMFRMLAPAWYEDVRV